jgi:hypothetical protein
MLFAVQRGRINTVTDFPVLVPASQDQQEGVATFLVELGPLVPVRALRNSDLKNASQAMTESEAKHFAAVMMLREALSTKPDPLAMENARGLFRAAYELKRKERGSSRSNPTEWEDSPFAQALQAMTGLGSSKEALELYEGLRPGPRATADPRWLLSYEVSKALRDAQLVLWWNGQRFLPAVYCPNIKTAFYARALLDIVGTKSFRICACCGDLFRQKRTDQDYCSISHREAHRVARWRARQKRRARTHGGKHGTRKTR